MQKVFSKSRNHYYWFNPKTKETKWEKESVLDNHPYIESFLQWYHCVLLIESFRGVYPEYKEQIEKWEEYGRNREEHDIRRKEYEKCTLYSDEEDDINSDTVRMDQMKIRDSPQSPPYPDPPSLYLPLNLCIVGDLYVPLPKILRDIFPFPLVNQVYHVSSNTVKVSDVFEHIQLNSDDQWMNKCPKAPPYDIIYIPFMLHEFFKEEMKLRSFFKFLYFHIRKGGYVIGMTLNSYAVDEILANKDHYKKWWKNSEEKKISSQSQRWNNESHEISYHENAETYLFRSYYGRFLYQHVDDSLLFRMAKEYKFEILEWKDSHQYYYLKANNYMPMFQSLVKYKRKQTDWTSLGLYKIFVIKKL